MEERLDWGTQNFDNAFQKINKFVTVSERREYTEHYNNVMQYIVAKLRERNTLFNSMFRTFELGGSYADGLKVAKPDEFDTDVILKLPGSAIRITKCPSKKDFVQIQILNKENSDLVRLMDEDGFLLQNEVLKWFTSILDMVLYAETYENNVFNLITRGVRYEVKKSQSGPALTLKVKVPERFNEAGLPIRFDMDIVVSFLFERNDWIAAKPYPEGVKQDFYNWTAIPKPDCSAPISRGFRASYRTIERDLINGRGKFKQVLRLFKKFRDTHGEGLSNLKSYHIKTIFMLFDERLKRSGENEFWDKNSTTKIFVMVYNLSSYVKFYVK